MSHELAAAGYGFVWPQVAIASDGEGIQMWSVQTPESVSAPVKYLTSAYGVVPADEFESALDQFFDDVIARLNALQVSDSPLHSLLAELAEERSDGELNAYRRLEAMAGYDPGEGPSDLLAQLEALIPEGGLNAAQEIATLTSVPFKNALSDALSMASSQGIKAAPAVFEHDVVSFASNRLAPAWVRGRELADRIRRKLGIYGEPIRDSRLYEIMGISAGAVAEAPRHVGASLGLAVRKGRGQFELHLRKRAPTSIRFELARLLCDQLLTDPADKWLPSTDAKTSRQKVQRAFAAEFLCPIDSLTSHLKGDFSDDALDDAAHHFQVSPYAVQSQLTNHDIIPRGLPFDFQGETAFPYRIGH